MDTEEHYLKHELYELVREDRSIFEFIQQGSLDGIWYWDLEDPESEWMSPRLWELLGFDYREKKHLASEWQDLIHPQDLLTALTNFKKHCEDHDHPYDQVVRYRHKDGSTVWVRCRGLVIRDDTGKPIRMLGAHTDLTQLKTTEQELRKKTIELQDANQRLREALEEVRTLRGVLTICASCKKIRDDEGLWTKLEAYIEDRSEAEFTHGFCPECVNELYPSEPGREQLQPPHSTQ